MFVVRSFSQLQEAVRFNACELLILGTLAAQIKDVLDEPKSQPADVNSFKSFTELGQRYEMVSFKRDNSQIMMALRRQAKV